LLAVLVTAAADLAVAQERPQAATPRLSSSGVSFQPNARTDGWMLTVTGPDGFSFREEFEGETPSFSLSSMGRGALVDGTYTYELTGIFRFDENTRRRLQAIRETAGPEEMDATLAEMRRRGDLPEPQVVTGSFQVRGGSIVTDVDLQEVSHTPRAAIEGGPTGDTRTVISGDLTVYNSLCVGFDCVSSESYGFDTIRLKENNVRIHFWDTSNSASFPTNDWRITVNDQTNGGSSRFSIDDVDAGRTPFTIIAGAPTASLYVDSQGDVGIGTYNPVVELHEKDGDTPTLRLEQDSSSGFSAQTWDVAGNEAGFFVRDATGGSTLPLRIRPGAPSSAIDIASSGNVGIGYAAPAAPLHVRRSDGSANTLVEETNGTVAGRSLLTLRNNGRVFLNYEDSDVGNTWQTSGRSTFRISLSGSGAKEFDLATTGELTITGDMNATAFNVTSSRTLKEGFVPVNSRDMLERLLKLPVSEWSFIGDESGTRHIGPMAEDFNGLFRVGADVERISLNDATGIAISSIQGLYDLLQERNQEIGLLQLRLQERGEQIDLLRARIEALEKALEAIIKK
jgi:hypothetical protein